MNYVKETMKYIIKNFLPLALIFIVPSVVLGFFVKPMSSISFIPVYAEKGITSYADVIRLVFNADYVSKVYPIALIFITILLSFCVGVSVIEKHFRVGKITFRRTFTEINEAFIPVLTVILICAVLIILYSLILISSVYLLHIIISGAGKPNVINIIVSTFVAVLVFILFMFLTGPVIFMMPLMITYGYRLGDAVTQAFALIGKKAFRIISGGVFPFLLVAFIEYALSFLTIPGPIDLIISIILYLYLFMYVIPYVMIVMFDLSGLERRDKRNIYRHY